MKKIVALTVVSAFAFLAVFWFGENRLEVYLRFSGRVTDANNVVEGARTFRGSAGHILLTVPESSSAPYIYLPEYREVLLCNPKTFVNLWAIGLQKRDRTGTYPCAGSGKQELKQNIDTTANSLEFDSWRSGTESRMTITW